MSGFKLEPGDGMELTEAKGRGEGIGGPTVAEKKRERSEKRGKERTSADARMDSCSETSEERRGRVVRERGWRTEEEGLFGRRKGKKKRERERGSKRQKLQEPSVKRKETRRAPAQETHRWAWRLSLRGSPRYEIIYVG